MDTYCGEILDKLHSAHDTLDFQSSLLMAKQIDWKKIQAVGDELTRMKIVGMAAEIYDHGGKYQDAHELLEADGLSCENILQDESKLKTADRDLLKQRVWILIHWGSTFYRAHKYSQARQLFSLCNETLNRWVITEEKPCRWTQARIYYSLGLVQRQVYDYKQARYWFTKSIELAWQSFAERTENVEPDRPEYHRTKTLTNYYVAKLLALGLAWTYYTEGALELAASLVHTARLLLTDANEAVISSYITILSASILSAQGRRREAIDGFRKAYDTLKGHHHDAYRVRAANELAVAYVHEYFREPTLENEKEARRFIKEVQDSSDRRWRCNALVTQSRLLRALGRFKQAEDSATEALTRGDDQRFVRIDARIARGEARLALNKIEEACKDFTRAQADGIDNRKVQAVCHLHLARAYLQKRDHIIARKHRDEATDHLDHVDNAFVRSLADTVDTMLKNTAGDDFYVSMSETTLDPRNLEAKLHLFLTEWAKHQPGKENEPWKALGISKQTFYNWRAADTKSRSENTPEESEQNSTGNRTHELPE